VISGHRGSFVREQSCRPNVQAISGHAHGTEARRRACGRVNVHDSSGYVSRFAAWIELSEVHDSLTTIHKRKPHPSGARLSHCAICTQQCS
jgi:hypothetical protein